MSNPPPTVPALDLDEAKRTLESKRSIGKRIRGSFKKMVTPRVGSTASDLESVGKSATEAATNAIADVEGTVTQTVTAAKTSITQATDEVAPVAEAAVEKSFVMSGGEVKKATDAIKTESGSGGNRTVLGVGVVAIAAVVGALLAASAAKKKEEPSVPEPAKKKGFW